MRTRRRRHEYPFSMQSDQLGAFMKHKHNNCFGFCVDGRFLGRGLGFSVMTCPDLPGCFDLVDMAEYLRNKRKSRAAQKHLRDRS